MNKEKKPLKISFSAHYPKLDLPVFTTIRPPYAMYYPGKIYWIEIKGRLTFKALLLHCQMVSLKTLSLAMIKFDTYPEESRKKFLDTLENWYRSKDFWRRNNSRMQILLFYKDFETLKPAKSKIKEKPKKLGLEVFCG